MTQIVTSFSIVYDVYLHIFAFIVSTLIRVVTQLFLFTDCKKNESFKFAKHFLVGTKRLTMGRFIITTSQYFPTSNVMSSFTSLLS